MTENNDQDDTVCRGSWALGTACGKCRKCLACVRVGIPEELVRYLVDRLTLAASPRVQFGADEISAAREAISIMKHEIKEVAERLAEVAHLE